MSRSLSIFLDILRIVAAVTVVAGHLTESTFSSILPDLTVYAVCAVAVFFVLSGFVISYVTAARERDPIDYAAARISRLYSVQVPAIALTAVIVALTIHIDHAYAAYWQDAPSNLALLRQHPVGRYIAQSLLSLTFLNEVHNHDAYPVMNSPMWSLGFEGAYYLLFGVALFTRGMWRLVLLLALALLFGGGILRLLPVWIAGVVLHRITTRVRLRTRAAAALGMLSLVGVAAAARAWPSVSMWCMQTRGPVLDLLLHGRDRAEPTWLFYYWGSITCLLIFAVFLLEPLANTVLSPLERPVRWLASHTFSTYLFHYPLLVLVYAVTHYNRSSPLAVGMVFVVVPAACILLSTISESKKKWWRLRIGRLLLPLRREPELALTPNC